MKSHEGAAGFLQETSQAEKQESWACFFWTQVGSMVGSLRWGGGGTCSREEAGQESEIKPPQRNWGTATSVSKMRPKNKRQAGDKLHLHP